MESFIKIITEKNTECQSSIHEETIALVRKYVNEGHNVFICGDVGVGKTYVLREVLKGIRHVEIQYEHLKSKNPFLTFIKNSDQHCFIEDFDSPTFKCIVDKVSSGGRLTRGGLIVTCVKMCLYPNFKTVIIPRHKPCVLMSLTKERGVHVENAAIRANGNIRNFFSYIDGNDIKDTFKTPKEFITDILTDTSPIAIQESIHEHGHLWDIFVENYINSKGVHVERCLESFSLADLYDEKIYKSGEWCLMPYFVLHALTIPKFNLGAPLDKDKIRPGSCWTKHGNFKMRKHKLEDISKKGRYSLGIEELCLLRQYAINGNLSPLLSYDLTTQDFDVINHLAIGNKLKLSDSNRIKRAIRDAS